MSTQDEEETDVETGEPQDALRMETLRVSQGF